MAQLLRLFATLPVTTASAERSFSQLRRLKTYLRSIMGEEHLTGLALVNVYTGYEVDMDAVVNHFKEAKPRRIQL